MLLCSSDWRASMEILLQAHLFVPISTNQLSTTTKDDLEPEEARLQDDFNQAISHSSCLNRPGHDLTDRRGA